MRVVHICNLPLFPGHPDFGRMTLHPGRWVLNLALAQRAEAGIDARLVVQVAGASRDCEIEVEGVPVHYVAAPDRLRAATLFWFDRLRLSRAVRRQNPALVHAHGTEEAHLLAAQASRIPSLVTIQGLIALINERVRPGLVSRYRVTEFTEMIALRRARHAIAKSDYIASELALRFPHLSIHRIPNTFDPGLLGVPESPRENAIAFVGSIDRRKGVHLLADAIEILVRQVSSLTPALPSVSPCGLSSGQSIRPVPTATYSALKLQVSALSPQVSLPILHVFGDRPESGNVYEEEQKSRLRQLLGNRVIFHGTVPAIEVAQQLSRVRALVAPSLEEMFGNQLIESLLVGTHGIVTEGTAMAENVRRFGNGTIVPQEDPAALADAIAAVMGDLKLETGNRNAESGTLNPERSSPLQSSALKPQVSGFTTPAERARQRIIDDMGPAVVAKAHRELYEKILTES